MKYFTVALLCALVIGALQSGKTLAKRIQSMQQHSCQVAGIDK